MSATMPPSVLSEVCSVMHIDMAKAYHLNLGVDHPNIAWEMRHMKAGKSDLDALRFILPQSCGGEGDKDTFKQTIVFGDNINTLMEACRWVRENPQVELHSQVAVYSSRLTPRVRRILLQRFEEGKIKVLFTTEAAGMVGDLSIH